VSWLRKACKNYGQLLELQAAVNNHLRKERVEELTGEEKTKLTEAIIEYEKILADLSRIYKSDAMETFRISSEGLIKWVGDEIISLGYTGMRERSRQYWLWDVRTGSGAEEIPLPLEKKMRSVLDFYGVETYDVFHVPTQQESERELLDFLENVKKWSRERLSYLIHSVYPLKDDAGGFWTVIRKIVELQSLKDVWDDFLSDWHSTVQGELKKTPEFEVLKTTLLSEWEAGNYLRDVVDEVKKELVDKYAERIADPDDVKNEFLARAKELFLQRVAPEAKLTEVYEQVKPLVPPDKIELTRAGLWKATRWAFLHPQISVDAFASGQIWPLGVFTTEQAKAVASKILEKVGIKPVTRVKLTSQETAMLADYFLGTLAKYGVPLPAQYKGEFEKAMDINKTYEENLPLIKKAAEDILKGLMPDLVKIGQEALAELEAL